MWWLAGLPRRRARDRHRLAPAPGLAAGPGWDRRPLRRRRRSPPQAGRRDDAGGVPRLTRRGLRAPCCRPRGFLGADQPPSTTRPPPHTGRGRTRVPWAPRNRVHVDLLTADPEAEIRRLTALGADRSG
ncbi:MULTISPECIES: VOC family protein [unclassified Streptomyces]|uniref:VOC family protein n=1 Tax=unclassified Streptomyces TaxID=2593676 RepID=UPI0033BB0EA6